MDEVKWISEEDWETIVGQIPIVSVDLIVLHKGGVLLGKRENEPAKGEWFVPGGRVNKGETLADAVHRIGREELGTDVEIVDSLGAYEHFYETADVESAGGKHYVANGFVVKPKSTDFTPDAQHSDFRVFHTPPADLHTYTAQYLEDTSELSGF